MKKIRQIEFRKKEESKKNKKITRKSNFKSIIAKSKFKAKAKTKSRSKIKTKKKKQQR